MYMKTKITEESIKLFEKKGFSQTSIQDIVDTLGVTKGTFYYYFTSKEELLMDIHLNYINELLELQNALINDSTISYKEKLRGIIKILITDIQLQGPSARVFFREMRNLSDENAQEIKGKREQFRINIEKVLRMGVGCGEFKSHLKIEMVTFGILGMTNWSYQWYNPQGEITGQQLTDIFVDMIFNGIEE
jgi:TetR/AcrR family transcriptional regulator, cholesterol catabolism regulator